MSVNSATIGQNAWTAPSAVPHPMTCKISFDPRSVEERFADPEHAADGQSNPSYILTITDSVNIECEPIQEQTSGDMVSNPGKDVLTVGGLLEEAGVSAEELFTQLQRKIVEATGSCDHCSAEGNTELRNELKSREDFSRFLATLGQVEGPEDYDNEDYMSSMSGTVNSLARKIWRVAITPHHMLAKSALWSLGKTGLCSVCDSRAQRVLDEVYSSPEALNGVFREKGSRFLNWFTGSSGRRDRTGSDDGKVFTIPL